jgi:PAS domain S-box-containing protein
MSLTAPDLYSVAPQIPGYTIVEQLYFGSRTAVYRAIQTVRQHSVVIKVLRRDYPSFSELVQFRNQYTIAKHLSIPGIIQPLSLEPLGSGYALVMEDWGGVALGKYVQRQQLNWSEVVAIALQLADILHDLAQQRVVHKDIKPANILIQPATQQVKLIDFSIASLLPKETQEIQNPNVLEGTLAYLSPEQTGRMNRGIDYRSDFYALGVTLFELLTEQLPFQSNDPMEIVHCHLAKQPASVCDLNPDLPLMLGEIIRKLMAKNAEDRYQSALGLKHDLVRCQQEWQATGKHTWFELGQRDVSDRFLIPETLYGREAEVGQLLSAFDRVANGASELMLVAGFSGIGKTAVVNEVHKPIVRQRGYFIKGKFDQFNRNIPLSAFVQALRDLIGQLLSETDAQLQSWKTQILAAVGENGQVLVEVIPELEHVIGKQPAAPELSGSAAQNRFNLLFQKFIAVFTTIEHPLVIFVDDLQWADAASLQLINLLMADNGYLLLLGAYRDNEVSPVHPFMLTVADLKTAGAIVHTLTLKPLTFADTNHLIADTLNCTTELAQPLSELINHKTQGNPFFTTQFLKALHEDGYITFDAEQRYWSCDLAQVKRLSLTDDVVEFMAQQLQKLPEATQHVLKLAACIGNQFDLNTLAIVSEQSPTDTAIALWKALQEGLILPTSQVYKFFQSAETSEGENVNPTYRFLHDRVQQAAYSLIPDDQKQATHLSIGQLLHANVAEAELENYIFEIVNHWNRAIALILNSTDKDHLAQLNLIAGRKAKASSAYEPALRYFNTGLTLLSEQTWQTQPHLTLALHKGAAEAACFCGKFAEMEQRVSEILAQTLNPLDRVTAYEIQIEAYTAQNRLQEAIAVALVALKQCNIYLPEHPTEAGIATAMSEVAHLLHNRTTEDLLNLPEMTEAESLAAMQLLASLTPVANMSAPLLLPLVVLAAVKLSLQKGNTALSAFAYCCYGTLLSRMTEDIDGAYAFGQLGLQLVENLNARQIRSKVSFVVATFIVHCKSHVRESLPLFRESFQAGLEVGDITHVGYSVAWFCQSAYLSGQHLGTLVSEAEPYIATLLKHNLVNASNHSHLTLAAIERLQGTQNQTELDAQTAQLHTTLTVANDLTGLHFYWVYHLMVFYLFNETAQAVQAADEARPTLATGSGFVTLPTFYFYDSLTALAAYPEAADKAALLDRISANQTELHRRSQHAPMNFQHKYDLVAAERCRVLGNKTEAIDLYDRAIFGAKANGYIQEEALANELAARFYLEWGKQRIAQEYMTEAYYGYARWGANAKVADLETRYPQLLAPILQQTRTPLSVKETVFATGTVASTSSSSSISDSLDLAAILKASQTLSSEIELDKLLSALLHTIIQTAGADKCVLILLEDDRLMVQALAELKTSDRIESEVYSISQPVQDSREVPISLVNTVRRSLQPAVITDATAHPQFGADVYIQTRRLQSILCSPILHQGKLLGLVYLENNLATGAFTRDRVELLNLLCAQAAISLENSRLYRQVQQALEDARLMQFSIDRVTTPVCWVEPDARISYVNDALCQDWGYPREEIVGRYVYDFNPSFSQDTWGKYWQEIRQQGSMTAETQIRTKAGTLYPVEITVNNITFNQKEYHLTFIVNISDRKAAEATILQKSYALEQALQDLQNAQLQMVQSEKMASLGNLVAGVAHEINNPIGFLNGSISNAKDYVQDLLGHLALYQQHHPNPAPLVQDNAEDIDLEFLSEDLPKLLNSMKGATDRIKGISTSLRTFSRADTEYKVSANIHEGIDSTILILKYRLKANQYRPEIQVIQDYGDLPEIECFPGQLNQVFMNILANAIDMFDEMAQTCSFKELETQPQQITIQTTLVDRQALIYIRDNGKGMSEDLKARIFDHLFTTKTVGKGTGLGLAIARQIVVEKHGGHLEVQSQVGQGSEFCIWLPMRA